MRLPGVKILLFFISTSALLQCSATTVHERDVIKVIKSKGIVEINNLTDEEIKILASIIRKEASPCGKNLSLFDELRENHPCMEAVRATGFIYRRLLDGYGESDIITFYTERFKKTTRIKIDINQRPATGPPSAPITIVVFSDFQCPFCAKASHAIKQIREKYNQEVRVVFKHFPLKSIHPQSLEAAIAAEAAFVQNRFWQMHDNLFALKGELNRESIEKAAENAGVDIKRWKEDMNSPEVMEKVTRDKQEAIKLNLKATPTIFINGIEFEEPIKYLDEYIKEILLIKTEAT